MRDTNEDNTNYMYMMCKIDVVTFINGYYLLVQCEKNNTYTKRNSYYQFHWQVYYERSRKFNIPTHNKSDNNNNNSWFSNTFLASFGLRDLNRLIANFIFAGTSKTSKTKLSKAIAEADVSPKEEFCRLNMSEYQAHDFITNLFNLLLGYIKIRKRWYINKLGQKKLCSIVLFDETEKTCKDLLNILLPLLDNKQTNNSKIEIISFSDTFIIFSY